ncbi:MAG: hypothetical protein ABSH20_05925 [Tepidisphaeraceae bacterium]|jgi:hypothetical protein
MDCTQARERLFGAESLAEGALAPELAAHLGSCAACGEVLSRLRRMEAVARELPVPVGAAEARAAFLEQLQAVSARRAAIPRILRVRWTWWSRAMAASIVLCIGMGAWFVVAGRGGSGSDVVIDRLVAWNVALIEAGSPQEAGRIYADQAVVLRQSLDRDAVSGDAKELGAKLLENGAWLSVNTDPLARADRFCHVADMLLKRIQPAAAAGDIKSVTKLSRRYHQIVSRGVDGQLRRVQSSAINDPDRKRHYDRVVRRNADLDQQLQDVVERSPEPARKALRRELGPSKRGG